MAGSKQDNKKPKGLLLKESREGQELSLESVHEATKIPLDVLRSIEEGYTVRTISSFYSKGFLKMYAQHLGVDVHEVLEDYHEEKLPERIKEKTPLLDASFKFENFFTRQRQRQMVAFAGILLLLLGVVKMIGCVRQKAFDSSLEKKTVRVKQKRQLSRAAEKKKKARKKQAARKPSQRQEKKVIAPKVVTHIKVQPKPAQPVVLQPVKEKVTVSVKAQKKAWLQVRTDGNVVFQSTLKQGISETWHADKVIELSGKNIYYLEFDVNGKSLGLLGRENRDARRVIITKDGLTVKK